MKVWVYQDESHGDIFVFSTLEKAKAHIEACYDGFGLGEDAEWIKYSAKEWSYGDDNGLMIEEREVH